MITFSNTDKEILNSCYQEFLKHLKEKLLTIQKQDVLNLIKLILNTLHEETFSENHSLTFSNDYNFLGFSSDMSLGMHIFYGIAACRHATEFLKDILDMLGITTSFLYIFVDEKENWQRATPPNANHIVLLFSYQNKEYLIDACNKFILEKHLDGSLSPLELTTASFSFTDENIQQVSHTLKKYYHLRNLGVSFVYDD